MKSSNDAPTVVLDSNVVLDLWLFADPASLRLRQAIEGGALRWAASSALREELAHVLSRPSTVALLKASANNQTLWSAWDHYVNWHDAPLPGHPTRLRCTDEDDQKFIDLALSLAPCMLLSRDKAVLRLARRAAALGVRIATPAAWLKTWAA